MFTSRFPLLFEALLPLLASVPVMATPLEAVDSIKIASVAPEYRPMEGVELPEPVSMQSFSFEVEPATGRARVVIDYTYPDQAAFGVAGGSGPQPTMTQLPGLQYDAAAKAVVYETGGRRTVCATIRDRKSFFLKRLVVTPTGACAVTSRLDEHTEDDGWRVRKSPMIDTFFQVR